MCRIQTPITVSAAATPSETISGRPEYGHGTSVSAQASAMAAATAPTRMARRWVRCSTGTRGTKWLSRRGRGIRSVRSARGNTASETAILPPSSVGRPVLPASIDRTERGGYSQGSFGPSRHVGLRVEPAGLRKERSPRPRRDAPRQSLGAGLGGDGGSSRGDRFGVTQVGGLHHPQVVVEDVPAGRSGGDV